MNESENKPAVLNISDEQAASMQQIGALLAICSTMAPYVLEQHAENPHQKKEMDGGVQCAVDALLIRVCGRLEALADDDARWKFNEPANEAKRKLFQEILEANRRLLQFQAVSLAENLRPSRNDNVGLYRISSALYAACCGPLAEWRTCLVGVGSSPEEALRDYDLRHAGQPCQSLDVLETIFPENPKRRK